MKQYLDLLDKVLQWGIPKQPVRADGDKGEIDGSTKTIGLPNVHFSHDMENGFPLLTTKKVSLKNVAVELEFFIKGYTDKRWLQKRKCHIWDKWSSPVGNTQYDLGPIYGKQWRRFNSSKDDQLKKIVKNLRENSTDRRMVCSAWNPSDIPKMALPPCHYSWSVTVYGDKLHLNWSQRSGDLFLGIPYNIASYGLLLTLLSYWAGLKPGNLACQITDCHLYENQIEHALTQIKRKPKDLPQVIIPIPQTEFDLFSWTHHDIEIKNYEHHPEIRAEVVK